MDNNEIRRHITRQYSAGLAMLGQSIASCPDQLWNAPEYTNRFWQVAYHTAFYTHLYLQPTEADFCAWAKHKDASQYLGARSALAQGRVSVDEIYTKADLMEYHGICCAEAERRTAEVDLEAASGFSWIPFNKLELQFYNIRHLQHHTGQLADRLRVVADSGITWVRPN